MRGERDEAGGREGPDVPRARIGSADLRKRAKPMCRPPSKRITISATTPIRSTVSIESASRTVSEDAASSPVANRKSAAFGHREPVREPHAQDRDEHARGDQRARSRRSRRSRACARIGNLRCRRRRPRRLQCSLHRSHSRLTPHADNPPSAEAHPLCLRALSAAIALVGSAGAALPNAGTLSVEQGKGNVTLEIRGSVLGRLANGTRSRHRPDAAGPVRPGGARPQAEHHSRQRGRRSSTRARLCGSGCSAARTKLVIKGTGISVSAVGKGFVTLDGDPRFPGDVAGYYSLDGTTAAGTSRSARRCRSCPSGT